MNFGLFMLYGCGVLLLFTAALAILTHFAKEVIEHYMTCKGVVTFALESTSGSEEKLGTLLEAVRAAKTQANRT